MNVSFYLFGTGKYSDLALKKLDKVNICGYIDNSENKIGSIINGFEVISFSDFLKKDNKNVWIVISVNAHIEMEIAEQLINANIQNFVFFDEIDLLSNVNTEDILARHNVRFMEYYKNKNSRQQERISFFINHIKPQDIMPEKGYRRKRQLSLIMFASELINQIGEIDIHPFLICGNLLGKYRHNGFIPWDDDLDLGLFRDEYERFIDFCKKNYTVVTIDDELPAKDITKELKWIDTNLKLNPDGFLTVYPTQLQFNYGTNFMDRIAIDFWCFDRYSKHSFNKHKELLVELKNKLLDEKYGKQFEMISRLKDIEKPYVSNDGDYIYFSLDSSLCIERNNDRWIDKDIILPLQYIEYEGKMFLAPNRIKEYLCYEYKDMDGLPGDCGEAKHIYRDTYMRKNYITVEFYLVDAFEIYHFIPLYTLLRKHGIYAIFICEPKEINTSGKWFDYNTAINILNEHELEYSETCNIDADIAFTTQYSSILRKYRRAVKVNMAYGCSLNKNAFWFDSKAIKGFDYKFVGGEFVKQKCLEKNILDSDHVLVTGFPKHYGMKNRLISNNLLKSLEITTNKKILCYFPTWDEDSSILKFADSIEKMRDEYFIITKPHHCTFRLLEKKAELDMLYKISDVVLDGNYNFEEVAYAGDVRLCDAKSGAALESIFVNPDIPTIFLSVRQNIKEYFYPEIYQVASAVVNNPVKLNEEVRKSKSSQNINMDYYFCNSIDEDDLWNAINQIVNTIKK